MASTPDLRTLQWFSNEYHDLNGTHYETLQKPPSALEFSRLVRISRPVVINGLKIPALTRWTDEYLVERMGDRGISVAVTPNGRADAVTPGPDGVLYFVEPQTQQMTMREFLSSLSSRTDDTTASEETCYLQSQNGNMYSNQFFERPLSREPELSEFELLRADVPSEISWCSQAFDRPPDAVNLWIGNSRSVTSIHSDPYENIYTVIRGTKHFTLLPPTEGWCLQGFYSIPNRLAFAAHRPPRTHVPTHNIYPPIPRLPANSHPVICYHVPNPLVFHYKSTLTWYTPARSTSDTHLPQSGRDSLFTGGMVASCQAGLG